jgi:hypothetical protein
VLNYLRQVAPGRVAATKTLFATLTKEEAKWPMQDDMANVVGEKNFEFVARATLLYSLATHETL